MARHNINPEEFEKLLDEKTKLESKNQDLTKKNNDLTQRNQQLAKRNPLLEYFDRVLTTKTVMVTCKICRRQLPLQLETLEIYRKGMNEGLGQPVFCPNCNSY